MPTFSVASPAETPPSLQVYQPEDIAALIKSKEEWHHDLPVMVDSAHRYGTPLSILFTDLDSFKDVNDQEGHVEGDRVIHEVLTRVLPNSLRMRNLHTHHAERPLDIVGHNLSKNGPYIARAGGDESAIAAATGERGAKIIANRIEKVFDTWLNLDPNRHFKKHSLGISIGRATLLHFQEPGEGELPLPPMTTSELLIAADKKLKQEKNDKVPPKISSADAEIVEQIAALQRKTQLSPRAIVKHLEYLNRHRA